MLTADDDEALRVLSLCARIATSRQIARLPNHKASPAAVERRLKQLRATGLIGQARAAAIELPELIEPLVGWRPGEWVPEFGPIAWILHRRWQREATPVTLFYATARGAQLYGGKRSDFASRAGQISHDLGVMDMFLAFQRLSPHLIKLWIDENRLAPFRRGEKLPDAVLADSPGSLPLRVLEFGGRYGKVRLQAFHDDCEARGLPYEIW